MIWKGELEQTGICTFKKFAALAAELCPVMIALLSAEKFATKPKK